MAIEITIPRLGWSMDEGIFVGWLKGDGDVVREGEPLFTLQGEKATQDVEALDGGTLRIPASSPVAGATVPVGAIIGYLLQRGDSDPVPGSLPTTLPSKQPAASTVHREPIPSHRAGPRSSPLARRIAKEHGIDWTRLKGSGSSGRIRRADVLDAIRRLETRPTRSSDAPEIVGSLPISPIRRTIAGRMVESRRMTAPVTLTTSVDVSNLVELRRQFKEANRDDLVVPSFLDFTVKLTALALRDHPMLNARWDEEAARIIVSEVIHIGIAVDTEAGLLVPVIYDANGLGLGKLATLSADLITRAKARQLRPNEMQGSTFTVTNLGAFGVEFFTPIINPPECAILGMGKIERRPVFEADKVVGRYLMGLSLTFDHRIVDGAPAARFLQHLARLLETPAPWLMT